MLKRQRPSSPFPSSSDSPIACDPYNDLQLPPATKRQRIAPPSLDGPSRGWGGSHTTQTSDNADDGEEDLEYEDDHDAMCDASSTEAHLIREKYKSTNTMLSELHIQHQHRILFAPSALPTRSTPLASASEGKRINAPISSSSLPGHSSGPNRVDHSLRIATKSEGNKAPLEDQDVAEKYKQTNKLLGDLVLSRRRQIGSSS
ncbi:hypothetical protein PLEOSDRAFT_1101552 [Pleurotus ostreatus PC15]|uniref:Uncharacterized protein n=2 Tax=Pleurotus TaxID=5320 RepID=A0A067NRK8_PLEO1|nr:hypothetical protein PLEOSDRAFT_1101552 [Pleurotus ostreatus PC15]